MTLLLALACTSTTQDSGLVQDSGTTDTGTTPFDPDVYAFTSALTGEDSVSYGGQVFRQLLIDDMKIYIGGLTEQIDNGDIYPADGDVEAAVSFYLDFDSSVGGQVPHLTSTDPATTSSVYDDISSGKNLTGKIAGNDVDGQTNDWSQGLIGSDAASPEAQVREWIAELDDLAAARVAGEIPTTPSGEPIAVVYVTEDGRDLQQLLQKFLRGSIAYSQATDDYLDHDWDEKGLLADHTAAVDGKPYTELEHAWDEAFGYFGASRFAGGWTDEQIAARYLDVDGDGAIDLSSEYSWGHSVNAAKRDGGSVSGTDFTAQAWDGFVNGRWLLANSAGGWLQDYELQELMEHRDQAVDAWEKAIASTVVHYINDTLQDMNAIGTEDYVFEDHAKHWSELKGFALALQFNPRCAIAESDLDAMHAAIGDAPTLQGGDVDAAKTRLLAARTLIGTTYDFDDADLGDDLGENGW